MGVTPTWGYTDLQAVLDGYLSADDVLTRSWLHTLVLLPEQDGQPVELPYLDHKMLAPLVDTFETRRVLIHPAIRVPGRRRSLSPCIHALSAASSLPDSLQGPVLITLQGPQLQLWPVYRLYSDKYRTFLFGMYPPSPFDRSPGSAYRAVRAVDDGGYNLIPVPSRLYTVEGDPAVTGKRIAVKGEWYIGCGPGQRCSAVRLW